MNKMFEDYTKKEELHDDLVPWVCDDSPIPMVKHPLVMMFHHRGYSAMVNKCYEQKCKMRDEYLAKNLIQNLIEIVYEKPYRVNALVQYAHKLSDADYWQTLASVWTSTEYIHQDHETWYELLNDPRGRRSAMMDKEEKAELRKLPKEIVIYRGGTAKGWSWTLDEDVAKWFANRFDQGHTLHERVIKKREVIALLNHRSEHEIIWTGARNEDDR